MADRAVMRRVARRAAAYERARDDLHGSIRAALRQKHSMRAVAKVAGVSASTVQRIAGRE